MTNQPDSGTAAKINRMNDAFTRHDKHMHTGKIDAARIADEAGQKLKRDLTEQGATLACDRKGKFRETTSILAPLSA